MNTTGISDTVSNFGSKSSPRPLAKTSLRPEWRGAALLLAIGLLTGLWASPAKAGFIVGSSANLTATDIFLSQTFLNQTATVGAISQFAATQSLGRFSLDWTARLDANSLTIGLTTSAGIAVFGNPRYMFDFSGLSLGVGTNLGTLALVSESNFDAVVSGTGANSIDIGVKSFDTRHGVLTATATFALQPIPEPTSGIIFGTLLAAFALLRRATAGNSRTSAA